MNKRFYIINCRFDDWIPLIKKCTNILHVRNIKLIPKSINSKIILFEPNDHKLYSNDKRAILKTDINSINTLNDKCLFTMFMMENFPENIPKTLYVSRNLQNGTKIKYIADDLSENSTIKMIEKEAFGNAGTTVRIVDAINKNLDDVVVTQYIEHAEFYTGHILIKNGTILKQIYFKGNTNNVLNYIQHGAIKNYTVVEEKDLGADTDIFGKIFKKLNYTGLTSANFIIIDKKIILFEINPRPGGSLIHNEKYFKEFIAAIMNTY